MHFVGKWVEYEKSQLEKLSSEHIFSSALKTLYSEGKKALIAS